MNKVLIFSVLSSAIISGCGGGGGNNTGGTSSNDAPSPVQPTTKIGYFRDAPVTGVEFRTETQLGFTGEGGSFKYLEGETVQFDIGTLHIGSTKASRIITPFDMTSFLSVEHDKNTNMVRVLMSLDEDENPDNGIEISKVTRDYLSNDIDASHLDITKDSAVDEFALALSQIDSDRVVPSKRDAVEHFNETVKCALSGVFLGEYSGDGQGAFLVAIEPDDLKPVGLFKPEDSYLYEWFGFSGLPLEVKGGSQPLALGSSTEDGEYADVAFSAEFSFDDVIGKWSQSGQELGSLTGERFVSSQGDASIKYVGTFKTPGEDFIGGVIQIVTTKDNFAAVDWYDTAWNKQEHYGSVLEDDGEITLTSSSEYETSFSFNIGNTAGEKITTTVRDSQGEEVEVTLSSCRI